MKKLFFSVIAVSLLTITSCGNKTASNNPEAEQTEVSAELEGDTKTTYDNLIAQLQEAISSGDQQTITTTLANLAASYKALVNSDQLEQALQYGQAIKNYISENSEALTSAAGNNTTISNLISAISNLPTDASTTAEQAKDAISSDVVSLASSTLQDAASASATASSAAEALKNLPSSAKEAVTEAANNAVSEAESKVSEKVNEAASNAAEKVNEKVNEAASNAASSVLKGLSK